jgi:hypothetical protein
VPKCTVPLSMGESYEREGAQYSRALVVPQTLVLLLRLGQGAGGVAFLFPAIAIL